MRPILFLVALLLIFPGSAFARTWLVAADGSGDFTSVQAGINAAQVGDSVLVAPGTYIENIRFAGRDIVLKSQAGPEMTMLDGSSQDRSVVEFLDGESNACVIEGFTITGGRGTAVIFDEKIGGGIVIQDSEPTVVGNIVEGNTAFATPTRGAGGGVFCRAALPDLSQPVRVPQILNNVIRDNAAGLNGGGIGVQEKASAIISGNVISRNSAAWGDGGGIWLLTRQTPEAVIMNNQIHHNDASDHGGGVYAANLFHNTTPALRIRIEKNSISSNLARGRARTGDSGGGIWLNCTDASVVSNTIVSNQGQGPNNSYGGGIVMLRPGSPTIENNIIALTVQGGGVLCRQGATPTFRNNLLWSNDGGGALGGCTEWLSSNGNIQVDPLFCDAQSDDYSLPPNSPGMIHPSGPIGAIAIPGCSEGVVIQVTTWGSIKARWSE